MIKNLIYSLFVVFLVMGVVTTASAETAQENQIPLNINTTTVQKAETGQTNKLIFTLVIITGTLGAGYFFIKRYAYSNSINKSNLQIKVMAQHHLGPKKSLAIIRVAGESILLGVTEQNINMIKSLSLIDDEVENFEALEKQNSQQFKEVLAKDPVSMSEQVLAQADVTFNQDNEDDFTFSGLKHSVSQKLKSMKTYQ